MINDPALEGERLALFEQALLRLGQTLERSLGPANAEIARDLEAAAENESNARDRLLLMSAAGVLRQESSARANSIVRILADQATRSIEYARHAEDEARALDLLRGDDVNQQMLVSEMARAVRQIAAADYLTLTEGTRALWPGLWTHDDLNPLGAHTLAAATVKGLVSVASTPAVRVQLRRSILRRLPAVLALALEDLSRWVTGSLPAPVSPPKQASPPVAGTPTAGDAFLPTRDLSRRAGEVSPRTGEISPRTGEATHRTGPVSPRAGKASARPGPVSPKAGEVAPRAGNASRRAGDLSRRVDHFIREPDDRLGSGEPPRGQPPAGVPAAPAPVAGMPAAGSPPTPPGDRTLEQFERTADAARVLGSSPLASASAVRLPVQPTLQPVVELERDAVAFAHSIGAAPYGREARARFFGNARDRLRQAAVPPAQLAVVDVVAAMFDYVIDDHRLPESVKPMIWRLQQPALALSLLDPAYLGDEPRSLRRMIENIGSIANAFADDMGRGSELHRRLETVVRAVEIVAGALQARSAVMARQVEQEYARAARNVGQLIGRLERERADLESARGNQNRRDYRRRPTAEREQEVSVRLSVMLGERLERFRVPESVREFLLTIWLRQLRTAALRDGEESGEFKVAMQVVDDLLWSLNPEVEPGGRRELALRIPPLIRMLTQGMRDIGVKDEELKPFFDELFLVHLRKMQGEDGAPSTRRKSMSRTSRSAAEGAASVSLPPGQPPAGSAGAPRTRIAAPPIPTSLRRRPESAPTPSRGDTVPDTLPDTLPRAASAADPALPLTRRPSASPPVAPGPASRAGTPANQELLDVLSSIDLGDLPRQPRAVRLADADPLAHLARGVWLQLDAQEGGTVHAKVAWINSRRTAVLMVRHPDRRAVSMGTTELAQRFAQGRAFLIE